MMRLVDVRAPSRLHFGMFGFGHADDPQWGGVGVMVDPPAVRVVIELAESLSAEGALAERATQIAKTIAAAWKLPAIPACRIRVDSPPDHVGLGVGTQLSLAVASGMRAFLELEPVAAATLAESTGRGQRSAVGTHGFQLGGLIVDRGRTQGERFGALAERVDVPADWRFVLIRPRNVQGLAGACEYEAFLKLPVVPKAITARLWEIVAAEMVPAVKRNDCARFGDAVHEFGRIAGGCFAAVQGSAFANAETANLVAALRLHGIHGAGQSSWGPTVFAVVDGEEAAVELVEWLRQDSRYANYVVQIARPNNSGVQTQVTDR